ncbi:iron complex outermembrane recepter protein [Lampropedia hyalina DSM 16112]|jgi:iron complex outermembrane receptor protein|uniref:Iron complex outermembrane recepter protein n=1 Tax=Lampropedia hyalina DSM 16112 TaxID=1122156 RepID=A0A1M5DT90_9BURK|nr:iron complex outermembrane recepter protein [Lampropedia hyalina DSM 16112]
MPKRAEDEPLARLTLGVSADSQWRAHADVGHRFGEKGEWGIRVNGSYQNGDTPMDNQSQTSHVGALALDYRGERLRASVDLVDQEEQMDVLV